MTLDKNISIGNIISWIVITCAMAAGWAKMEAATAQSAKDARAAVELAEKVEKNLKEMDVFRQSQITSLTVDVAVLKVTAGSIDKKLDQLIANQNPKNP